MWSECIVGCITEAYNFVFFGLDSVLHLVPHHVPGYPRCLLYISLAPSDQNLFCYFKSLWFFCPSSPIFNRHFLFISLLSLTRKETVYSFDFRHWNIQHIYIYSNPSPDKTKTYKKLHYCVVRVIAVERTPVIGIIIQSVFFSAFCTIQSIFFVPLEAS